MHTKKTGTHTPSPRVNNGVSASFHSNHGGGAQLLLQFLREEDGQTLVDYGLLISLLAIVMILAVTIFGNKVNTMYNNDLTQYVGP